MPQDANLVHGQPLPPDITNFPKLHARGHILVPSDRKNPIKNSAAVYYELRGPEERASDTPVLAFAHALFMSGAMFIRQTAHFAKKAMVLTWDMRGHGQTMSNGSWTHWDNAKDLGIIMDHLNIQSLDALVGLSQGGYVALRFALDSPDRVKSLILLAASSEQEDAESVAIWNSFKDKWTREGKVDFFLPTLMSVMFNVDPNNPNTSGLSQIERDYWAEMILNQNSAKLQAQTPQVITPADFEQEDDMDALIDWTPSEPGPLILEAMTGRETLLNHVPQLSHPILLLHGDNDQAYSREKSSNILAQSKNPDSQLFIIPDAPHFLSITHPDEVNDPIDEFLERIGVKGEEVGIPPRAERAQAFSNEEYIKAMTSEDHIQGAIALAKSERGSRSTYWNPAKLPEKH